MSDTDPQSSVVQYIKSSGRDKCGYCKTGSGLKRYGLWAFHLNVEDYQSMIDRGWRRSGHYCYKPILPQSCCPMYTIRCDASEFRLSRSQKRILKSVNAYLLTGNKQKAAFQGTSGESIDASLDNKPAKPDLMQIDVKIVPRQVKAVAAKVETNLGPQKKTEKPAVDQFASASRPVHTEKAKFKRIQKKLHKLKSLGLTDDEIKKKMVEKKKYPVTKTLEDFIDVHSNQEALHSLEVRLVRSQPRSEEFNASYDAEYELYKKYQAIIHKDPPHKISKNSFDNFLVNSPLYDEPGFGSFHMQYWLDKKLIAVGVVDILLNCLSSVYLFYDPDYSFLSLGTYSALREVYHVRSLTKTNPIVRFYYMGFYIHLCKKMSYKAAIKPSFLLCPEVLTWHPFVTSRLKIEVNSVSRLNDDRSARDEDGGRDLIPEMMVIYDGCITDVASLTLSSQNREILKEFASVVGKRTARRIIVQLVKK